jgi:hypothetical protein
MLARLGPTGQNIARNSSLISEWDPEPQPPMKHGALEVEYNDRLFYDVGAFDEAELTYLLDWKSWDER